MVEQVIEEPYETVRSTLKTKKSTFKEVKLKNGIFQVNYLEQNKRRKKQ